jgi:hypothetical protein
MIRIGVDAESKDVGVLEKKHVVIRASRLERALQSMGLPVRDPTEPTDP